MFARVPAAFCTLNICKCIILNVYARTFLPITVSSLPNISVRRSARFFKLGPICAPLVKNKNSSPELYTQYTAHGSLLHHKCFNK